MLSILSRPQCVKSLIHKADSMLNAPSQWETSLQSNAVSHWLGANLESALHAYNISQAEEYDIHTRAENHACKLTPDRDYCYLQWECNPEEEFAVPESQPERHRSARNGPKRKRKRKSRTGDFYVVQPFGRMHVEPDDEIVLPQGSVLYLNWPGNIPVSVILAYWFLIKLANILQISFNAFSWKNCIFWFKGAIDKKSAMEFHTFCSRWKYGIFIF